MGELTESLMKGLEEAIAIKNGELELKKREDWPCDSYYVPVEATKDLKTLNTDNGNREIIIKNEEYSLSKIIEGDREIYVELQRQINGDATFYLNPISKDIMWDLTIGDDGLYVILDTQMNFCGTVEIKDKTKTPEIGISLLEAYRNKGIAKQAIQLLLKLTYEPSCIDYYIVRIESDNKHSQHVFEKMGAECCGEDLSTVEKFKEYLEEHNWEEKYKDVLTDVFTNHEGDASVLRYRLDPKKMDL